MMEKRSGHGWIEISALGALIILVIWSYIDAADRLTWWLEAAPALFTIGFVIFTKDRFQLTPLLLFLLWIECIILLIGAHYTYAHVPFFDWVRDTFELSRNHYDRVGHFAQGFIPAIVARELLLRTSPLRPGKWLFTIITLGCLGISAAYELIEWIAAITTGAAADEFLAIQGDEWDTQKDMALALIGAILAQLFLGKTHDRQLEGIGIKPVHTRERSSV